MSTYTAIRTWNKPRTKATIVVFCDGVEIDRAGGKRAERAQAVVLSAWGIWRYEEDGTYAPTGEVKPVKIYGLRGDAHAAQVEADRLVQTRDVKSSRYGNYTTTPAAFAEAVLVTEAK